MTDFRQVWCLHAYSGGTVRDSHPVLYSLVALLPHPQALKRNIYLPIEYHPKRHLSTTIGLPFAPKNGAEERDRPGGYRYRHPGGCVMGSSPITLLYESKSPLNGAGLDLIIIRFRPAVAGGARPRRI